MCASLISSRIALRLLCGTLLVMALLDVPVVVGPDTAKVLGALFLVGVIGALAALAWPRRCPEDLRGRSTRGGRKGDLVAPATR